MRGTMPFTCTMVSIWIVGTKSPPPPPYPPVPPPPYPALPPPPPPPIQKA